MLTLGQWFRIYIEAYTGPTPHVQALDYYRIGFISQIWSRMNRWPNESSHFWLILNDCIFLNLILIGGEGDNNSRADKNFGKLTVFHSIPFKYFLQVGRLSKSDGLLMKIHIYFHPKIMWDITQICHPESVLMILHNITNSEVYVHNKKEYIVKINSNKNGFVSLDKQTMVRLCFVEIQFSQKFEKSLISDSRRLL